eukprot:gnl/TRDRNA2_/TRDRNA2_177090_c1_seq2.p1 gnl/TRDRNA2_/TRDRNA2_177090_c1~~gnl/TRDRNA2_/TRDRNA2_177090_c1_seq2.p1  ORF type:complete len:880 (-),score=137.10 gnl/TRDRNA2_/TRDRNA2_177090_c1_seq2:196-2565(-)
MAVMATGPHATNQAVLEQTQGDVGVHAVMFLPVALLIMHTHLCTWQFLILPAACALMGVAFGFMIGYIVANYTLIDASVPTIMSFLGIALSTDWAFFLLARFREERLNNGKSHTAAIIVTIKNTGANIALSAIIIIVCCSCMYIEPLFIGSNSIGICIVVSSCLSCTLSFLPACLGAFPTFFAVYVPCCESMCLPDGDDDEDSITESDLKARMHDAIPYEALSAQSRRGDETPRRGDETPKSVSSFSSQRPLVDGSNGHNDGPSKPLVRRPRKASFGERMWYSWAVNITWFPMNIIVVAGICTVFMPATMKLWNYTPYVNHKVCLPMQHPAVLASEEMKNQFAGTLVGQNALYIMLEADPKCPTGVQNNAYFEQVCNVGKHLLSYNHPDRPVQASDMYGIAFYNPPDTQNISCFSWRHKLINSLSDLRKAMEGKGKFDGHLLLTGQTMIPNEKFDKYHHLYLKLWSKTVSEDKTASLVALHVDWDIVTHRGFRIIHDVRELIEPTEGTGRLSKSKSKSDHSNKGFASISPPPVDGYSVTEKTASLSDDPCSKVRGWELSVASVWYDFIREAMRLLPYALALGCALCLPIMALGFGSVCSPVKLVVTVALPLSWVYGLAVWCFQDGLMDWLGPSPFHSSGGLFWMAPCSTSMLLLALALDYSIFYYGRVFEFRKNGLNDLEAIRKGLSATGPVITCAGMIFATEFSGLVMSETIINKQLGFCLVMGVIMDTFVIRSSLVPAILSIAPECNWWPTQMPAVDDDGMLSEYDESELQELSEVATSQTSQSGRC